MREGREDQWEREREREREKEWGRENEGEVKKKEESVREERRNVGSIDFNGMSTRLGLFHDYRVENRVHCMFLFTVLGSWSHHSPPFLLMTAADRILRDPTPSKLNLYLFPSALIYQCVVCHWLHHLVSKVFPFPILFRTLPGATALG